MTSTTLQQDIIEETFYDVEESIKKIVWKFIANHGGEFDELKAEANYAFIRGMYKYPHNEKRGSFRTWLYHIITTALADYLRFNYRPPSASIDKFKNSIIKTQSSFSSIELLDGISQDARTIIILFLDTPKEIYDEALSNGKSHRHLKASLKRYLLQIGWTLKRITDSFEEIKNALTN